MIYIYNYKKIIVSSAIILPLALSAILYLKTINDIKALPESFNNVLIQSERVQIQDRFGEPLNKTYENKWNIHDIVELHEVPEFLINSFVLSEDKRFFKHDGIDWYARLAAVYLNLKNFRIVRGASTITEQVVRMINKRPRTLWSKWIEGWEAQLLEKIFTKSEILQFYLNQIPYASNRRGIVQAARYYFDRDLETLSPKEFLALVVLVRAPSRMDLYKDSEAVEQSISSLTQRLIEKDLIFKDQIYSINTQKLNLHNKPLSISAPHFIQQIKLITDTAHSGSNKLLTTLDSSLQSTVQLLLDNHLKNIESMNVYNGSVLVADHITGEILAWVVAGRYDNDIRGSFIDAVTVPRQPGSALKPLLYAMALEKGWTASTIIEDSPLTESIGHGLHSYQNYSRTFYGPVTLRQALANSLNIPAVKTLQYVGAEEYLKRLSDLGFDGLTNHPNFYGDSISLGNGEVSLYQLAQAYSTLANKGILKPFILVNNIHNNIQTRVYSEEASSLIANILSDSEARSLEFGDHSVLNFPIQTAVKTGTSSDYRDAWALGFNYKYTVGIWMGNLDQTPTDGLTGSTGPALLLRAVFNELTKNQDTKPLYLSPKLIRHDTCINMKNINDESCILHSEWYIKGTELLNTSPDQKTEKIHLRKPVNGLHLAYNPRIPASSQSFEFLIQGVRDTDKVLWIIDGDPLEYAGGKYEWSLKKGSHLVSASVWRNDEKIAEIENTRFYVK